METINSIENSNEYQSLKQEIAKINSVGSGLIFYDDETLDEITQIGIEQKIHFSNDKNDIINLILHYFHGMIYSNYALKRTKNELLSLEEQLNNLKENNRNNIEVQKGYKILKIEINNDIFELIKKLISSDEYIDEVTQLLTLKEYEGNIKKLLLDLLNGETNLKTDIIENTGITKNRINRVLKVA